MTPVAGTSAPTPARSADRQPSRPSRAATPATVLLAALALFLCYVTVSRKVPVTSDAASSALQAWDMLHGNWLLHRWWLSDVSFYTTELPEYMFIETVRGLSPDVVHVAAGLTYTLLVLGAACLARGQAAGWIANTRMLLGGGIMLAPQLAGVPVLMLAPDHLGSAVPVLAVLLLLDRAPSRWWVPALTGAVLSWALVADKVLLVTAVLPLLAVCAGRVCHDVARRQPLRSRWLELWLICAAVVAVGLSSAALALIAAHGGFRVMPLNARLVPWPRVLLHLKLIPHGLGLLFGVSTTSHAWVMRGLALLHLAGLALAVWGVGAALWRFPRLSLVDQLLVSGVLINLLAYVLLIPGGLPYSTREYTAVLPLSAALAGRMAGRRLLSPRLAPVTASVLAGYVLSLATVMSAPAAPSPDAPLARWLLAHHLDYGLGPYGSGNITTVSTGNQVHVVVVEFRGGRCYPVLLEAQASAYDPRLHDATFLVQTPAVGAILRIFGPPDHVYRVGLNKVLVWRKNLLEDVQPPPGGF